MSASSTDRSATPKDQDVSLDPFSGSATVRPAGHASRPALLPEVSSELSIETPVSDRELEIIETYLAAFLDVLLDSIDR